MTLHPDKDQIRVTGELLDTASGKPVGRTVEAVATSETLKSTMRGVAYIH